MNDHPDAQSDPRLTVGKIVPRETASERAAKREASRRTTLAIAAKVRTRANRQRIQALLCVSLIAMLLLGGGVFFYFAQTIALNELKAQSEFVGKPGLFNALYIRGPRVSPRCNSCAKHASRPDRRIELTRFSIGRLGIGAD